MGRLGEREREKQNAPRLEVSERERERDRQDTRDAFVVGMKTALLFFWTKSFAVQAVLANFFFGKLLVYRMPRKKTLHASNLVNITENVTSKCKSHFKKKKKRGRQFF